MSRGCNKVGTHIVTTYCDIVTHMRLQRYYVLGGVEEEAVFISGLNTMGRGEEVVFTREIEGDPLNTQHAQHGRYTDKGTR